MPEFRVQWEDARTAALLQHTRGKSRPNGADIPFLLLVVIVGELSWEYKRFIVARPCFIVMLHMPGQR
jgi:hypothetical protein